MEILNFKTELMYTEVKNLLDLIKKKCYQPYKKKIFLLNQTK